ncbi:MAG: HNH endonuclease [Opitutales bacterium]|jgi:5-methylcytosine-specific restriction endonuclease McrA
MEGAVLPREEPAAKEAAAEDDLSLREPPFPHSVRRVLVLNRNWQAVNIVGVRRAFALLFREDAKVVEPESGSETFYDIEAWIGHSLAHPPLREWDTMRTVNMPLRIPPVLILTDYDRLPMKEVHLTRENIFARDEHICQYCGKRYPESELNIDHVIPRERGGRNTWENLVTSCIHCNGRKANRLPHEAGMRLQRKPRRPPRLPFSATVFLDGNREPEWNAFLPV